MRKSRIKRLQILFTTAVWKRRSELMHCGF